MKTVLKSRRSWLGKATGAGLGFLSGGPVGLVIGAVAGHLVDRVSDRSAAPGVVFRQDHIDGLFRLSGHLAKADGHISKEEIHEATRLMDKLRLEPSRRQQAIRFFNDGKAPLYRPDRDLYSLNASLSGLDKEVLLSLLLRLAYADKTLQPAEIRVLKRVCDVFGVSAIRYLWLKNRARVGYDWLSEPRILPETRFRLRRGKEGSAVQNAYSVLGLEPDVSDADLKITYRRRMSEFHPDKLHARGASVADINRAKEKAQTIQTAYNLLRKHRRGER